MLNNELYTCSGNKITEVATPKCSDCARYKAFYTKQANGSYKAADGMGYCSLTGYRNVASIKWCVSDACFCKSFVPEDPEIFKQIWIKTPAN